MLGVPYKKLLVEAEGLRTWNALLIFNAVR